jgi:hypothetical protein
MPTKTRLHSLGNDNKDDTNYWLALTFFNNAITTARSGVLYEGLIVAVLLKNSLAFYWLRRIYYRVHKSPPPVSVPCVSSTHNLIIGMIIPDDEGSTYIWNVGRKLFYTAVHPRRQFWTYYKTIYLIYYKGFEKFVILICLLFNV